MKRGQVLKTLALSAPLALVAGFAANAGGYNAPVVEPVVAPVIEVAPVVGDWQGAYAGVTLGYAFQGKDRVGLNEDGPGGMRDLGELKLKGVNGGVRGGYRWQNGNWVFGPEVSFEGGNIKNDLATDDGYSASSKIKNVFALRAKVGYAVQPDLLIYGSAGAARAKVDYTVDTPTTTMDTSFNRSGYVVGLGVEKKLTERMSLTGEYEYANFGKETLDTGAGITKATPKYNNVRVGLNFQF
ncbi:outer membrane protein [Paracoccus aminophilus]|uniref:Outer membrane protein n=1 Tax=Paracoccus aminophilus JCM 7686 TaxID=1367847 RepID=S5XQL1_PARAH|nr:outer membrane protein [Paracoccus aminophilus]AGT07352.1 outer membrane protein [Paracoccus aminophilus JCM 7686]